MNRSETPPALRSSSGTARGDIRSRAGSRPIVSVLVPTYNRAHLVGRAVKSVLHQTFEDFELLVVDDGSSDNTREVVAGWTDPRVRYTALPSNRGVSAARNHGIRESSGEFIAFLDSDDEWMPRKLELQVQLFRESPPVVGLTYTGVENVDDRGARRVDTPHVRGRIHSQLLVRNVIHGCSGVMIRRSVVEVVGYFDEEIPAIEDYDYWLRVARHFKVDFLPDPLLRYHDPAGVEERKSLNTRENFDAREYFFAKHRREMRQAGVAHRFLMDSAWRHRAAGMDRAAGRRLAIRAALEKPLWWEPYSFALGTLPEPMLRILRAIKQMIPSPR